MIYEYEFNFLVSFFFFNFFSEKIKNKNGEKTCKLMHNERIMTSKQTTFKYLVAPN